MAAVFVCFPGLFVRLFIEDTETVAYGMRFLRGMALSVPLLGVDFLSVGVFQAVGMGKQALIFALLRKIVLEIPFLYLLNRLFPLYGIAYAQAAAELIMAIAAVVVLSRFLKRAQSELDAPAARL